MPERNYKIHNRVETDEVQGEDSYVEFRRPTLGESRDMIKKQSKAKNDDERSLIGMNFMADHVEEWNWVDDDGNPLPQPKDDPKVMEKLTDGEVEYLTRIFREPTPIKN